MTKGNVIRNNLAGACLVAVIEAWKGFAATAAGRDASKMCSAVAAGNYDVYHLPAITHPPAGVSAFIDWAKLPSNGGWSGAQIMDSCRYHPDGFLTWHGKAAARIEVQPNDDPLNLGAGSERAEMMGLQDSTGMQINETSASGTVYYATSYYFPSTWDGTFLKGNSNSWSFVWQFYGWQGFAASRGYAADPAAQKYWFGGISTAFSDGGNITKGLWTDFVFMVNWGTGHLSVWRRNEGLTAFTLVLDANGPAVTGSYYVKQGLYRGGDVSGRTDVLWVGPTARGSTFSSVELAAFGTNNGTGTARSIPLKVNSEAFLIKVIEAGQHNLINLSYNIPYASGVTIGIYDARGRLIRRLIDENLQAGSYKTGWDGRDGYGIPALPGMYLIRMKSGTADISQKIVLLE